MSGKRRPNRRGIHPVGHPEHPDWRAEHPASPPPSGHQPPEWTDLAPYASTGGLNQYSPMGQVMQETNFTKGLLRNRHWYNRVLGWVILIGLIGSVVGLGLWRLITLFT